MAGTGKRFRSGLVMSLPVRKKRIAKTAVFFVMVFSVALTRVFPEDGPDPSPLPSSPSSPLPASVLPLPVSPAASGILEMRTEISGDEEPGKTSGGALTVRAGEIVTLSVFVDHPAPTELIPEIPPLPENAFLVQWRVLPFTDSGGNRFSRVDLEFVFPDPGRVIIPPVGFSAGEKKGRSAVLEFDVLGDGPASLPDRGTAPRAAELRWGRPSNPPRQGEAFTVALYSAAGNPSATLEQAARQLRFPPPPGAIVETAVSAGESALLTLKVIPLDGPEFRLPGVDFVREGSSGETGILLKVPPLVLPVLPPTGAAPDGTEMPADPGRTDEIPRGDAPLPWPETAGPGFSVRAGSPPDRSRIFWEGGRHAEALALMRGAERDLVSGPSLRPLRAGMEVALGLSTQAGINETWRPRLLFLLGGIFSAAALFLLLAWKHGFPRGLFRGERPRQGPLRRVLAAAALVFLLLFAWFCVPSGQRCAIARETALYRAPDPHSSVLTKIAEGERLRVFSSPGAWLRVETAGGADGWIPADSSVYY